jgi:uncharacterized protein
MDLPDVNPLVYAADKASPFHGRARRWLEDLVNSGQPFGISHLTMQAAVRILTNPKIYTRPLTLEEALGFVDKLHDAPQARILRPGPTHWSIFTTQCRAILAKTNDITDAYHAALAIEHGCEFLTLDDGFARFPGLKWRKPF